jgi:hypothetical protein
MPKAPGGPQREPRLPYTPPRMIDYGPIVDLTRGES